MFTSFSSILEYIFKFLKLFINLYISMFFLHVCPLTTCVQCLWKTKEAVRSAGTGFTDSCEPSHISWRSNLGLLDNNQCTYC